MRQILAILSIITLAACHSKNNAVQLQSSPNFIASIDTEHYTTITWLDSAQQFATINEGDTVRLAYHFKNTGATPLFLTGVHVSCGCTAVTVPQQAILPGKEDTLVVTFNSKYHPGFNRRGITVKSNTKNGVTHVLVMEGTVVKAAKK